MRGTDAPELVDLGIVACNSALAWLVYRATLPWAIAKLGERREIVLRAVTRE
jgi:hypothetical protein